MKIEINSCKECIHFTEVEVRGKDSWDRPINWVCGLKGFTIAKNVEPNEVNKIPISPLCPFLLKENELKAKVRSDLEDKYIKETNKFAFSTENQVTNEYVEWLESKLITFIKIL